jgi:hypothetical protein
LRSIDQSLSASAESNAWGCGDGLGARKPSCRGEIGHREPNEVGDEEEEPAALCRELALFERELSNVGHRLDGGTGVFRALLVEATRQRCKALFAQDVSRGRRGHSHAALGEGTADVVDRVILLAQRDDFLTDGVVGSDPGRTADGRHDEELPCAGVMSKAVADDAEGPFRVAELPGRVPRRESLDEVRAEGLILTLSRGAGREEEPGGVC